MCRLVILVQFRQRPYSTRRRRIGSADGGVATTLDAVEEGSKREFRSSARMSGLQPRSRRNKRQAAPVRPQDRRQGEREDGQEHRDAASSNSTGQEAGSRVSSSQVWRSYWLGRSMSRSAAIECWNTHAMTNGDLRMAAVLAPSGGYWARCNRRAGR